MSSRKVSQRALPLKDFKGSKTYEGDQDGYIYITNEKVASKSGYYRYDETLIPKHFSIINYWISVAFRNINHLLRGETKADTKIVTYVHLLERYVKDNCIDNRIAADVFRGSFMFRGFIKQAEGVTIKDNGFMSFSTDISVASKFTNFLEDIKLVRIPKEHIPSNCCYVNLQRENNYEAEVLFLPGTLTFLGTQQVVNDVTVDERILKATVFDVTYNSHKNGGWYRPTRLSSKGITIDNLNKFLQIQKLNANDNANANAIQYSLRDKSLVKLLWDIPLDKDVAKISGKGISLDDDNKFQLYTLNDDIIRFPFYNGKSILSFKEFKEMSFLIEDNIHIAIINKDDTIEALCFGAVIPFEDSLEEKIRSAIQDKLTGTIGGKTKLLRRKLEDRTVAELKETAAKRKISVRGLKKIDIIAKLRRESPATYDELRFSGKRNE